jgi:hypothetical protein
MPGRFQVRYGERVFSGLVVHAIYCCAFDSGINYRALRHQAIFTTRLSIHQPRVRADRHVRAVDFFMGVLEY